MEEGSVRFIGSTQVKGKKRADRAVRDRLGPREPDDGEGRLRDEMSNTRLTATFGNTTIEMGPSRPVLHMGRGPENEFVVPGSAGLARPRQDRVPPRPVSSHRSEPERHLPADARHEGSGAAQGRNRTWRNPA
jgi:hypothetical protein